MKQIPLTNAKEPGFSAQVSDEDYARASAYRWYAIRSKGSKRTPLGKMRAGHSVWDRERKMWTWQALGSFILNLPMGSGAVANHCPDKNPLNCQRENLQVSTRSFNRHDSVATSNTGYKNVYLTKSGNYRVRHTKTNRSLGTFPTLVEALLRANENLLEVYGPRAAVNPIPLAFPVSETPANHRQSA